MNECLMIGVPKETVSACFKGAQKFEIPGMLEAKNINVADIKLPPPMPTVLSNLDGILDGGLRFGLTLISAEGGMGKSAFSLFLATQLMRQKQHVAYFPYEGGADKFFKRFEEVAYGDAEKLTPYLGVNDPN